MHVILMSERPGRTLSFRLGRRHGVILAGLLLTVVAASGLLGFRLSPPAALPEQAAVDRGPQLDQLALRVGELQARLSRLSAIGDRVAGKAGLPLQELAKTENPGQGGPLESAGEPASLTSSEIAQLLDALSAQFSRELDRLQVMDSELLDRQVRQGRVPMDKPIGENGFQSSSFGIRPDPFTGRRARHNGLDFSDEPGAPIMAAETGVVLRVEHHPQYGNMVDLDHGNGLVTRYGHAGRLLVRQGEVVKRGQKIAEVGSTGRSTGPHLHFEVLRDGAPQNPAQFLKNRS